MKIEWWHDLRYRSSMGEYANVTAKGVMVGGWTTCKDYLVDRYMWGFSGVPDHPHVSGDCTLLTIDKPRILFSDEVDYELVLNLVNKVDKFFGFEPSTYEAVDSPSRYIDTYWEGDPRWMIAPPMFGLWLFLLRNASDHSKRYGFRRSLKSGLDFDYFSDIIPAMDFIRRKGVEAVFGTDMSKNWTKLPTYTLNHCSCGPAAYASLDYDTKKYFPHWLFPRRRM